MPIGSRAIGERTRARQHERGILELRRRRQQKLAPADAPRRHAGTERR